MVLFIPSTLTHLFVKVWKHWFSLVQQSHAALPPGEVESGGGRKWDTGSEACRGLRGGRPRPYLMCVAGRLSYCRDRKSSLWRSWCFCLSVSSASAGLSFSSSSSSVRRQEIDAVEKLRRYRNKFSSMSGECVCRETTGAAEAEPCLMNLNQMIVWIYGWISWLTHLSSGRVPQHLNVPGRVLKLENNRELVSLALSISAFSKLEPPPLPPPTETQWFIFCAGANQQNAVFQAVLINKHQATRSNSAEGRCKLLDDHFNHTVGVSFNEDEAPSGASRGLSY